MDQILLPMEAREVPERSQFPARASPQLQERAHGIGKVIAFLRVFEYCSEVVAATMLAI